MYKFSKKSELRMDCVHPELTIIFNEAILISPIDFGIPMDGGVRTTERQREMFLDPAIETNCDGVSDVSNHQVLPGETYGMALDYFAYVNGAASWRGDHMAMIAGVILSTAYRLFDDGRIHIELVWGGTFGSDDFGGWDAAHIEVKR